MRRYDLDWLRVLVFGLLIVYHVGMFFVPWGFHIKNNEIYEWLVWPMRFLNQWRLPILFVISGMGTWFALNKRSGREYAYERVKRLFLPLFVGMLLIVPPQVYFERIAYGQFTGSYPEFWLGPAFDGVYPEGNTSWHHLWFLPYLLTYSLALFPVFLYLKNNPESRFISRVRKTASNPAAIFVFIIPLFFIEVYVKPHFPVTHALTDDWYTFTFYIILFFYGFLFISVKDDFWKTVLGYRKLYLIAGVACFGIYFLVRTYPENFLFTHFAEALIKTVNLWAWILTLFGYAAFWLNKGSRMLTYCNEAVYPFYILHQTITITIGYFLMNSEMGFLLKFLIMITGTFGICFILYEFVIRRIVFMRPLFGLKVESAFDNKQN